MVPASWSWDCCSPPSGSAPEGIDESAGQTLAGAVDTAGALPAVQAEALLASAREAFTVGLNLTAGVGIVVFGALALVLLRETPTGIDADTTDESDAPAESVRVNDDNAEPTGRTP